MEELKEYSAVVGRRVGVICGIAAYLLTAVVLMRVPGMDAAFLSGMFGFMVYYGVYVGVYGYMGKPHVVHPAVYPSVVYAPVPARAAAPPVPQDWEEDDEEEDATSMELGPQSGAVTVLRERVEKQWLEKTDWMKLWNYVRGRNSPEFSRRALAQYVPARFYSRTNGDVYMTFPEAMLAIGAAVSRDGVYNWTPAAPLILSELAIQFKSPHPHGDMVGEYEA